MRKTAFGMSTSARAGSVFVLAAAVAQILTTLLTSADSLEATEVPWERVSSQLSLLATVTKGRDNSNWTPQSPSFQYDVEVRLKNTGSSPVAYDTLEFAFVPAFGESLRARQTSRDARNPDVVKTVNIGPGEETRWKFDTNGYTDALLRRSQGQPLGFEISLHLDGGVVAGPFRAELPDLGRVPASGGAPSSAVYLKFKSR